MNPSIRLFLIILGTVITTIILYTIISFCYKRFCVKELINYMPEDINEDDEAAVIVDVDESEHSSSQLQDIIPQERETNNSNLEGEHQMHCSKRKNSLFRRTKNSWPNWTHMVGIKRNVSHGASNVSRGASNVSSFQTFKPAENPDNDKSAFEMEENVLLKIQQQSEISNEQTDGVYYISPEETASQPHWQNISKVSLRKNDPHENLKEKETEISDNKSEEDGCERNELSLESDEHHYLTPSNFPGFYQSSRLQNSVSKSADPLIEKSESKQDVCESLENNYRLTSAYRISYCNILPLSKSMSNVCARYDSTDEMQVNSECDISGIFYEDTYSCVDLPEQRIDSYQKLTPEADYVPMQPAKSSVPHIQESPYCNTKLVSKRNASRKRRVTYVGLGPTLATPVEPPVVPKYDSKE